MQGLNSQSIFQIQSKILSAYQRFLIMKKDFQKSFINILRAYGLDQEREINIRVVESSRSKTKVLAYQLKQGGHIRIAKEELQELEED